MVGTRIKGRDREIMLFHKLQKREFSTGKSAFDPDGLEWKQSV